MSAKEPQDLHGAFVEAFNAGNIEGCWRCTSRMPA